MSELSEKTNTAEAVETNGNGQSSHVYTPEQVIVKFLGRVISIKRAKVYSTMSKHHVLIRPLNAQGQEVSAGTAVKLSDLSPKLRRKLGC